MKKKIRKLALITAGILILSGCGAKSMSAETAAEAPAMSQESYDTGYYNDMYADAEAPAGEEEYEFSTEQGMEVSSTTGLDSVAATSQKLIKTVSMSMETKEFDTLLESIRGKVEELGGYIESSEISGSSYYSVQGNRYAWLTLRIPAEKLDGFVTIVSELGNVTSKNESVEDITLQYVDVESHKQALETEQARLLELLEKAESMEDIIAIESRLSQVRYELQSYGSTLRTYDNRVNYSTVSIDISEVERVTPVIEERTFFEEIQYRLSDNLYDIGRGMRNFAIWFISSLPYLVIWALIIIVLVCLVRKFIRKKPFFGRKKKEQIKERDANQEQNKNRE
ncbi:MAG: DUF4349 domain-containing protein [Lachnospiraceae bacterium]|jgi:hypothetical protein|uniref:DUF4349 domain-containing protein n=1 Tax=Candidatus Merdisoma sp. JLR.KK006 TaxID=3112626 RepID=UPI002FF28427|nr:DUF4349 domain-containing protein [Lachnospiraceae bacterium]